MSDFVHLHTHSHYSLLDGMGKIDGLINRAKELEMKALALTDHGVLYGAIEFYTKANKAGIKPLIGMEAYVTTGNYQETVSRESIYHLILIAENEVGYKNLVKLTTEAHLRGYYFRPRIDHRLLTQHAEGLICCSACLGGELSQAILTGNEKTIAAVIEFYRGIFPHRYYLELQDHPNSEEQRRVNDRLIELASTYQLPLVATADVHYITLDDKEAHDALLCVQTGKLVSDTNRLKLTDYDIFLKSEAQIQASFAHLPQAITNTREIAERCNLTLELGKPRLPKFPTPDGMSADQYLRALAFEGAQKRYRVITTELNQRIEKELRVITQTGFADYFLIVSDFVNWAKEQGIMVGPGRGSAAGSLVSYALGITSLDPIKYQLIFERFLSPDRIAPPDIDLDFADHRRDEVINYVTQRYGEQHVAQIITFGTMAARNAVRDVGRVLGISYQEVDQLAKLIPFGSSLHQAIEGSKELKEQYETDPSVKKLITIAQRLEGVARHASTHAAGVVISAEPLTEYVPLQREAKQERIITQYDMYSLDLNASSSAIGLLKMDFLGLANLTILERSRDIIRSTTGTEIDLDRLPLDDQPTFALLSRGDTTGVFQLESDGMKRWLKELKPSTFEDILSMVALYRPGPMEAIPDFVAAKHGRKTITYLHPLLKPILEKTYGVIVTQDQVLEIARSFAGMTYTEADVLRKAVGKKIKSLLLEQQERFTSGAIKQGVDKETGKRVWEFIEPFARYGFNRAHAACYAMIAYQTAYLKTHFPSQFMAALLTSEQDNLDKVGVALAECERMKLPILPPEVSESEVDFSVVNTKENQEAIRFGLSAVKNVGVSVSQAIIDERKANGRFASLADVATRLTTRVLNKKALESLIKAGALDNLGERNQMLAGIENILKVASLSVKTTAIPQSSLFGELELEAPTITLKLPEVDPADKRQRLRWERELLSMYVSEHPLSNLGALLHQNGHTPLGNLSIEMENQRVKVAGVLASVQRIVTKNGSNMAFARLEDLTGALECIIFPKTLENEAAHWQVDQIVSVSGRLSSKDRRGESGSDLKLIVDKSQLINTDNPLITPVEDITEDLPIYEMKHNHHQPPTTNTQSAPADPIVMPTLTVTIPSSGQADLAMRIKQLLDQYPGTSLVRVIVTTNGQPKEIEAKHRVAIAPILKHQLAELVGSENIAVN